MKVSSLAGRIAVVTGSSSGIGRATAQELASAGAAVVVHAGRSRAAVEETAASIVNQGGQALVCLADVGEPADRARLVETAWAWQGRVDVWVNNAGVDTLTGVAAGWSFEEKLAALWRVDVAGTIGLSRDAGRRMQRQGHGTILNTGWDQAAWGMAGDSGELFAAAKGAVMAFSKSLALSLAPQVRVNCLAPGWIRTAWGQHASLAWQARACRESHLGRWGEVADVARAARFLASDEAAYLTGQVIEINGGFRWT